MFVLCNSVISCLYISRHFSSHFQAQCICCSPDAKSEAQQPRLRVLPPRRGQAIMKTHDASSGSSVQGVAAHIRLSALVLRSWTLSEMTLPPAGPRWCGSCDRAAGGRTRLEEFLGGKCKVASVVMCQLSLKYVILEGYMPLMKK